MVNTYFRCITLFFYEKKISQLDPHWVFCLSVTEKCFSETLYLVCRKAQHMKLVH